MTQLTPYRLLIRLSSFCLLLLLAGCAVESLEEDPQSKMEREACEFCEIIIQGKVLDGNDIQIDASGDAFFPGVSNAIICSQYFFTTTDDDGSFEIRIRDEFQLSQLNREFVIEVFKNGYLPSTIQINGFDYFNLNDCPGLESEINLDFVLTPKNQPTTVKGGELAEIAFQQECIRINTLDGMPDNDIDTKEFKVIIPADALPVGSQQDICITPLHPDQYAGAFDDQQTSFGAPVKRLHFAPAGLALNEPIIVNFTPDISLDDMDQFRLYTINRPDNSCTDYSVSTNTWMETPAAISYDPGSNTLTLELEELPTFALITATTQSININSTFEGETRAVAGETFSNCDCGAATFRTFEYRYRQSSNFCFKEDEAEDLDIDQIILANQIFRTYFNLPDEPISITTLNTNSDEKNQKCFRFSNQIGSKNSLEICLPKCTVIRMEAIEVGHIITGTLFDGTPFEYFNGASVKVEKTESICPITTPCHQGCP